MPTGHHPHPLQRVELAAGDYLLRTPHRSLQVRRRWPQASDEVPDEQCSHHHPRRGYRCEVSGFWNKQIIYCDRGTVLLSLTRKVERQSHISRVLRNFVTNLYIAIIFSDYYLCNY